MSMLCCIVVTFATRKLCYMRNFTNSYFFLGSNLSNRWNFIAANGNVKSQLSKSQSLRTCRRSLHKRLLHHKQKLMDMDQVKKNFMAQEQAGAPISKHQGKQFWKELTQFASKVESFIE